MFQVSRTLGFSAAIGSLLILAAANKPATAQVEAVVGTPFGVGRVTVRIPAEDAAAGTLGQGGFLLSDKEGRVFYPVFSGGPLSRLLGSNDAPPSDTLTVLFLFTGTRPLELTIATPTARKIAVTPRRERPRTHFRLTRQWWRQYNGAARAQTRQGDYPPLIETYLTSMLSSRLSLAPPLLNRLNQQDPTQPQQALQLLLGVESLREQIARDTMRGAGLGETADQPLPPKVDWTERIWPKLPADVEIEPIANRVPEECFYIRFGSFANFLWLDDMTVQYGGDIGRMINLRGHDARRSQRMMEQLVLKRTALMKVLGPQVINDVAMIGRDFYLREGAAVGVLFEARSSDLLALELRQRRKEALKQHEKHGATLKTVKIAGRDVSLLATPDNRLRSFYVIDGKYHLVTTSRAIVERFLENDRVLGAAAEFRHGRVVMPTSRNDTIFVYLSSAFFQGLVSPQYQIELRRRLESVTDMELLELARYAARGEGKPADTIEDLVNARLLPRGFGRRADGSGAIIADGHMIDSMRGARGSFLPVPDVKLRGATRGELARYQGQADFYRRTWTEMDPIMVGVQRFAVDRKGRERIVIDANITPLADEKYGQLLAILGPPSTEYVVPPKEDAIFMQAHLQGGLIWPDVPPHHLFLGVRDVVPDEELIPTGFLQMLKIMRGTPSYLGGWPKPGFLDRLPFGLGGQPDAAGFTQLPFGLWRWQGGGFSAVSFDQNVLAAAGKELKVARGKSAAQIRVHIGDLSQSKLTGQLNALYYERARLTSAGNTRLLHALTQQLRVPPADARKVAEGLLDVTLVCPLGGKYETTEREGGLVQWQSTAWPDHKATGGYDRPRDYQAPLLAWFRGMQGELTRQGNRLIVRTELEMQRPQPETKIKLPLLDLLNKKK